MAFNGASMGGVVFSPLWVALIAAVGFHAAAVLVAATVLGVAWLLSGRCLGRSPTAMGLLPDGDMATTASVTAGTVPATVDADALASPWRDRRFVTLAAAATLGLFAQVGLVAHLFSLLVPPLGAGGAGLAMGGTTACAIVGRSLLGTAMPTGADRRAVAAANAGMQAVGSGVLLCAGSSVPLLLGGCALFGLGLGNVTSLPPLVAQAEFRPADVSRVVALVTAVSQAGYAFAPAAFGLLRGLGAAGPSTGGGILLFAVALVVQLVSAATMLLGRTLASRIGSRAAPSSAR